MNHYECDEDVEAYFRYRKRSPKFEHCVVPVPDCLEEEVCKEDSALSGFQLDVVKQTGYAIPFLPHAALLDYVGIFGEVGVLDAPTLMALATTGAAMGTLQPTGNDLSDMAKFTIYTGLAMKTLEIAHQTDKLGGIRHFWEAFENSENWNAMEMGCAYFGSLAVGLGVRYLYDNWNEVTKPGLKYLLKFMSGKLFKKESKNLEENF